jgi:hypothetical protein
LFLGGLAYASILEKGGVCQVEALKTYSAVFSFQAFAVI